MSISLTVNYGSISFTMAECQQVKNMYPTGQTYAVSRVDGSDKFSKRNRSGDYGS